MEGFTHPSDADRELDELRARAYGPDPDIDGDPAALARLRELEAAHRSDVESRADAPTRESAPDVAPSLRVKKGSWRSLMQRATATWWSRVAWSAGALVVAGGIVTTILLVSAPRPDATLQPTEAEAEADDLVRRLVVAEAPWLEIDTSTLRPYEPFLGLEVWSGVNAFDSPCLVAVHQKNDTLSEWRCAPAAADLIMDVESTGDGFDGFDGVAGDGIIRFTLRGDTVEAYVYLMPEAG